MHMVVGVMGRLRAVVRHRRCPVSMVVVSVSGSVGPLRRAVVSMSGSVGPLCRAAVSVSGSGLMLFGRGVLFASACVGAWRA